jgi:exopolysaccharide production protein ExoZ
MSQPGPLANIQCLRALAAMMVVWVHTKEQFHWVAEMFPSGGGAHGVDLFFVLSGFIMVVATWQKPMSPGTFLIKRLVRIVPLYWLATAALLAIAMLAPKLMKSTVIAWPHVAASFLFFPAESPALPGFYMPLLVPGWTLNYEMAFYAVFGLALYLPQRLRMLAVLAVLSLVTAGGLLLKPSGALGFYSDAIIQIFGAGVVLGELHCRGVFRPRPRLGWVLVILGFIGLIGSEGFHLPHRVLATGVPALMVVWGACHLPGTTESWPKWLIQLGDASYSTYLFHGFVLAGLRAVVGGWVNAHSSAALGWGVMLIGLVLSAVTGWLAHKAIEVPLTSQLNRRLLRKVCTKER